jgi:hypothetical protein
MSERTSVGDLFRNEFADVLAFADRAGARLRRPAVARTTIAWALLAGAGAAFFVTHAAIAISALATLGGEATRALTLSGGTITPVLATALALAVAWRAGGAIAAEGYIAWLALERLLLLPNLLRFCERSEAFRGTPVADQCTLEGQLTHVVPIAVGALLAIGVAFLLARSTASSNGVLEAAGALAVATSLWSRAIQLAAQPSFEAPGADPATLSAAVGVSQALVAGVAGGIVLARRARWAWRGLVLVAAAVALPFVSFSLPNTLAMYQAGFGDQLGTAGIIAAASPLILVAACALAIAMTRRARRA